MKLVYMYPLYERIWHWVQALVILGLVWTGIEIHWPRLELIGFAAAVDLHNILAAVLVANAFLAFFYHVTTGRIRQYLPASRDFVSLMLLQTRFYLYGIFRGEPHPFEKKPEHKLNPLQKLTYLVLLNVLLPLQVLSGALLWGAQRWPGVLERFGSLRLLALGHTLVAWLLAAFIVAHVYLTTTGHRPLSLIRAMLSGWEEVEDFDGPTVSEEVAQR